MIDLERDCDMIVLSEEHLISGFDCGNADLNDFFNRRTGKRNLPANALRTLADKIHVLRYDAMEEQIY